MAGSILLIWASCVSKLGDITNWMDSTSGAFNESGLVENMKEKAGSFYGM